MIKAVTEILNRCERKDTNIPPTILYNEGWMIRLLVEISVKEKIQLPNINFGAIKQWYSEGLMSSPFLARTRGDKLAEGYTHADMVLGDFTVDITNRGDIKVNESARIFGVLEAKMGSNLTTETQNAPGYDQASRNLACIAFNTISTQHDIFFGLVAPEKKIKEHDFTSQLDIGRMIDRISLRFGMYGKDHKMKTLKNKVLNQAATCKCFVISYESWIESLKHYKNYPEFREFKERCYKFNKIG